MPTFVDLLKSEFAKLPTRIIEVGVPGDAKTREKIDKNNRPIPGKPVGVTNAELMFILENGSALRKIPARPAIQMTIAWAEESGILDETIDRCLSLWLATGDYNEIENELNRLCERIANYAHDLIYQNSGVFAPNAESTIMQKGFDHPLFQSGQLARSITARLVEL